MKKNKDKMNSETFGSPKKIAIVNSVTALRFIASFLVVPIFKALGGTAAAIFSGVFMATDWIDGFLARKFKASTFFGSIFDGVTDKTFAILTLGLLFFIEPAVYLISIFYEIYILYIQKKKMNAGLNVQSNMIGKIKTWIISASMMSSLIIVDKFNMDFIFTQNSKEQLSNVNDIKGILALLLTVIPTIIFQILTAHSYEKEYIDNVEEAKHDITYIDEDKEKLKNINIHLDSVEEELKKIQAKREKLKEDYTLLEKAKLLKSVLFDPKYYKENQDKQIRVLTKELFNKSNE